MSTVMVIDDVDVHCKALARLLRDAGHQTVTAQDRDMALHRLQKEWHLPDLIVLDVGDIDILDLLETLYDNPQWRSLPVVMFTGCSNTKGIQCAMRFGGKHYMIKAAFSVAELLDCVRLYTGNA